MKLDTKNGHSLDEVMQNLAETVAWCSSRPQPLVPQLSFRTISIAPGFGCISRKEWTESVVQNRRRAFWPAQISIEMGNLRYAGKLLAYFPDENLSHGIEEKESAGFVTVQNVPPWDTWIAYIYESADFQYLLSWVPNEMIDYVDRGIEVSAEECFQWIAKRCPQLVAALGTRGISGVK